MSNEHNNAPAVPQTVYLVENRTCLLAYASREDADKAVASMPASVGGGFLVSPVQVFGAPAPAVPQGIPAQEVIDAIEAWKSAWLKVPTFADRVNKATREAITISHNSLFLLLQSAQQAQRMPAGCPTPTGCGPHGCHGACIAATPAPAPAQEATQSFTAPGDLPGMWEHSDLTGGETDCAKPAQEVGLTDEEIEALPVWSRFVGLWPETRKDITCAIIAALRAKGAV